ncbi:MAG: GNAT family N-acetyltransferase [Candidatus Omnitrophota bacterium]
MPLAVKISRSITGIGQKDWESVYPGIPESYGYLKTCDETLRGQFEFYYVSIYDEGGIAFCAPIFVANYPIETTLDGPLKKTAEAIRRVLPKLLTFRAVICGSPACEGRVGIKDTAGWARMLDILVREMDGIARTENASVLGFKEFSEDYDTPFARLKDIFFRKFPAFPSVRMELPFGTFDEYFRTLSKKTQIDLKRKFKKTDGTVDIRMAVLPSLGALLDEAYGLYRANLDKAETRFEEMTRDFFRRIPENMPGESRYFVWHIDGRLAAFSQTLVSKDLLIAEYIGFDYSVAYKYNLYFIVMRDQLKWCIENGIRKYESGALNYDPKRRLGFTFVPQYIYARHRNRFVNGLLAIVTGILDPQKHDPVLKSLRKKP